MKWLVILAVMAAVGSVYNELESPDVASRVSNSDPSMCISTPSGTLCDAAAVAWCETNSKPVVVGIGDSSDIVWKVADIDAEQCARVGWVG